MLSRDQTADYLEKRRDRARAGDSKRAARPCEAYPLLFVSEDRQEIAAAVELCQRCPILDTCDALARELRPTIGVWGGRPWGPRASGSTIGAPA